MIKDYKISVLMSVFNSEDTLCESIDSILKQTFKNFEFLIVDDCSNDNSLKLLSEYEKNYNFVKIFKNNKNIGLTKSLNKLLKRANGNLIARQDADDLSFENRFENQIKFLEEKNLDACTTKSVNLNSQKVIPGFSYYFPLKYVIKYKNPFIHGSLLIKKDVINQLGGYNEKFIYAQDYKLLSDAIKKGFKIKILNKKLYYLNMENNISSIYKDEQKYYADCVKKNIQPIRI